MTERAYHIVDVDEEGLSSDLRVGEHENTRTAARGLNALLEEFLQECFEIVHVITACDDDLLYLATDDESCES
jgi:hypothetical protein